MQNLRLYPLSLSGLLLLLCISLQAQAEPVVQDTSTGLNFVTIPAGQFVTGTTDLNEAIAELPEPKATMIEEDAMAPTIARHT